MKKVFVCGLLSVMLACYGGGVSQAVTIWASGVNQEERKNSSWLSLYVPGVSDEWRCTKISDVEGAYKIIGRQSLDRTEDKNTREESGYMTPDSLSDVEDALKSVEDGLLKTVKTGSFVAYPEEDQKKIFSDPFKMPNLLIVGERRVFWVDPSLQHDRSHLTVAYVQADPRDEIDPLKEEELKNIHKIDTWGPRILNILKRLSEKENIKVEFMSANSYKGASISEELREVFEQIADIFTASSKGQILEA